MCQKEHWSKRKQLCGAIQELAKAQKVHSAGAEDSRRFISHLTPKQQDIDLPPDLP